MSVQRLRPTTPRGASIAALLAVPRRLLGALALFCLPVCAFSGETFDRIQSEQSLRVCIWPLRQGLTMRDWRTQTLSGVDIELSQELAKSLGVRILYVDSTYATMTQDLEQGRCDIAMFGLTIRPVLQSSAIAYSQPYLYSSVYAVTMKGNQTISTWQDVDQPGVMIGVLDSSIAEVWVKQHFKRATTVLVGSPNTREKEVQAGRIDLFLTDQIFGRRVTEVFDWVSVLPPKADGPKLHFGYAVKANDAEWLKTVNQFIDAVRQDGKLAAAARQYGLSSMLEE